MPSDRSFHLYEGLTVDCDSEEEFLEELDFCARARWRVLERLTSM